MQVGFVRHEMKQRIKQGIPEEQRVVIKITPEIESSTEVFTRIHSREFRYLGEMYDVLTSTSSADTMIYTCIHDVKESGLFKDLDTLVRHHLNQSPHEKKNKELAIGFFSQHYLAFDNDIEKWWRNNISSIDCYKVVSTIDFSQQLFRPPIC